MDKAGTCTGEAKEVKKEGECEGGKCTGEAKPAASCDGTAKPAGSCTGGSCSGTK